MKPFERIAISQNGKLVTLEFEWIARERVDAPLIVFLHEGLGSAAMWDDWPTALCEATGCRGLVYSRYGYGGSTRRPENEPWPVDYLEREAQEALPALLSALGVDGICDRPILFGHSDGGVDSAAVCSSVSRGRRGDRCRCRTPVYRPDWHAANP